MSAADNQLLLAVVPRTIHEFIAYAYSNNVHIIFFVSNPFLQYFAYKIFKNN